MTMPAETTPRRHTIQEYLRIADDSEVKLEYADGEILSMAGGTANHSLISENFGRQIGNRLAGKPCRVYDSNLRVGIPHTPRYMYPDKLVVCGKPEFDPRDKKNLSVTNPRLVVEVISESSEQRDRGEKFTRYRKLESLQEYVLVSQDRAQIETFFRQSDGTWLLTPYHGLEALVRLRSLEIEIPASEIYAGVEFPPEPEENQEPGGLSH